MTVAFIQEFEIADRSTKNYDQVKEALGDVQVPGLIIHTAGFDDAAGVFRIFDVWENGDDAKRFYEDTLGPILAPILESDPTATPPQREATYELHDVIR